MVWKHYYLIMVATVVLFASSCLAQGLSVNPCPCDQRYWAMLASGLDTIQTFDSASPPFKSPTRAFNYSFWSTVGTAPTIVLTVPGLIFGPSLGYFYAGRPGRAWLGIGLRTAGIGGMISAFAICGWDCGPGDDAADIAAMVFIAGAGLTVGSAIVDIASVKSVVRRQNESASHHALASIGPVYLPASKTIGFGVRLRL